jgi:hypothetical protein
VSCAAVVYSIGVLHVLAIRLPSFMVEGAVVVVVDSRRGYAAAHASTALQKHSQSARAAA